MRSLIVMAALLLACDDGAESDPEAPVDLGAAGPDVAADAAVDDAAVGDAAPADTGLDADGGPDAQPDAAPGAFVPDCPTVVPPSTWRAWAR